jgi:ubiquinone biosynthesis monooxygenase Coq7
MLPIPDNFIINVDKALRTVFATAASRRPYPDAGLDEAIEASDEETEHLAWCEKRLNELGSHKSFLNPLWYAGSFGLGVLAGALGDKWNLGFLAETERQVEGHLDSHLSLLPEQDAKSRAIVEQMKADEIRHAETAIEHGGAPLPMPVKLAMKLTSKVMTGLAYRV